MRTPGRAEVDEGVSLVTDAFGERAGGEKVIEVRQGTVRRLVQLNRRRFFDDRFRDFHFAVDVFSHRVHVASIDVPIFLENDETSNFEIGRSEPTSSPFSNQINVG